MSSKRVLLLAFCLLPALAAGATEPVTVINGATIIHPSREGAAAVEAGATIVIAGD